MGEHHQSAGALRHAKIGLNLMSRANGDRDGF
jgi:hypothetical protein